MIALSSGLITLVCSIEPFVLQSPTQGRKFPTKRHFCGFEFWATSETFESELSGTFLCFDVNVYPLATEGTITLKSNPMNLHECCMSRRPVFIYPAKKSEYLSRLIGATGHCSREVVKHR